MNKTRCPMLWHMLQTTWEIMVSVIYVSQTSSEIISFIFVMKEDHVSYAVTYVTNHLGNNGKCGIWFKNLIWKLRTVFL